jgi:hypothetical protein
VECEEIEWFSNIPLAFSSKSRAQCSKLSGVGIVEYNKNSDCGRSTCRSRNALLKDIQNTQKRDERKKRRGRFKEK